ncbi:hypothetical protein [Streptomyces sp. B3I8]|uniref:hypothetical protein n=1 Tax=Streptomyces sp. B3I8 TaxID=3042303 RepID=UPI002785F31A|nr:hypothetical protein [Streptomyces sp. B3I8]MDQ0785211.1 hypothetical protein [Streptomyces sp. B3I8]
MAPPKGVAKNLSELLSFYRAGTGSHLGLDCRTGTSPFTPTGRLGRPAAMDRPSDLLREVGAAVPRAPPSDFVEHLAIW